MYYTLHIMLLLQYTVPTILYTLPYRTKSDWPQIVWRGLRCSCRVAQIFGRWSFWPVNFGHSSRYYVSCQLCFGFPNILHFFHFVWSAEEYTVVSIALSKVKLTVVLSTVWSCDVTASCFHFIKKPGKHKINTIYLFRCHFITVHFVPITLY